MTLKSHSDNNHLAGIGLMLFAVFVFSCNDALGKWLLQTFPVANLLVIRSIMSLLMLAPFIWRGGLAAFTNVRRPGLQILRVLLASGEVTMFYWAVTYLPLADTMTFYLAGPVYVTALSALLLGEKIGWRRWSAVLVGFLGVIVALRPSAAMFSGPALVALTGSFLYALFMIVTRMVRGTGEIVMVSGQVAMTLVIGLFAIPFGWVQPSLPQWGLLAIVGIISVIGLLCVNRSLVTAPASVVVPYQYTFIIWALFFGYAVFGDVPRPMTLIGAGIIIAAGLYIFMRERAVGREPSFTPP